MKKINIYQSTNFAIVQWTLVLLIAMFCGLANAQITLVTDRSDATYTAGTSMNFVASSFTSGPATYTIYFDRFSTPIQSGNINLASGGSTSIPFQLNEAGVVICTLTQNGQSVKASATFDPHKIKAFEDEPSDFDSYWQNQKSALAAIPLDAQLSPYTSTAYATTYRVNLASIDNRRVYGYISIPNGNGPFPAVLSLPSFGSQPNVVTPAPDIAERGGAISLTISIHNAEPDQFDPTSYQPDVLTDQNQLYGRYALLAGIRAIDYLFSRNDFDGKSLAVNGVSQGGGLAVMLAGIDNRVQLMVQSNASHCQHSGLQYDRASGFPFYLDRSRTTVGTAAHERATLDATAYLDVVHFAKRYNGPSLSVISYEDETCPAATVFAAFNQLQGQKILLNARDLDHNHPNEYWSGRFAFYRQHFPAMRTPPWPWPETSTDYLLYLGPDQSAGINQSIDLPAQLWFNNAQKNNVEATWELVEGPGTASFDSPTTLQTKVRFNQEGIYTLQLTVKDYDKLNTEGKFYTIINQLRVQVNGAVDNTPPSIRLSTPGNQVNGPFWVTASVNEAVNGLTIDDLVISNATVSDWQNNGLNFQFRLTPISNGNVGIFVPANRFQDLAGNSNTASNQLNVNYQAPDTSPPTAFLFTANTQVNSSFTVDISLSEAAQNFSQDDFTVTNGNIGNWSGSGLNYQLTVTPINEGVVSLQIPANQFEDNAGNPNLASNLLIVNYRAPDTNHPVATLRTNETTVSGPFVVEVVLSENVAGFVLADVIVDNGRPDAWSGSGLSYNFTVFPEREGQVSIQIPANAFQDAAGNTNEASNVLRVNYQIVDNSAPIATLSTAAPEVQGPFQVTLRLNETPQDLDPSDLNITNATLDNWSGSGLDFQFQLTPLQEGIVEAFIPAGRFEDAAGNQNAASNTLEVDFRLPDQTKPTAVLSTSSAVVTGTFEVSVVFSENISGLQADDFLINNGLIQNLSGNNDQYTLVIQPAFFGPVFISMDADRVVDASGNGNEASNVLSLEYQDLANEILALSASLSNRRVRLDWTTNRTFEADRFFIERSSDSLSFTFLDELEVVDSSLSLISYLAFDEAPTQGNNFYRIRQLNKDGSEIYSNTQKVLTDFDPDLFVIYPNPTFGTVYVHARSYSGRQATIQLHDEKGRQLLLASYDTLPEAPIELILPRLSTGSYTLTFSIRGFNRFSKKLIVLD
ncbi:MAG: Ig-like domain-containing protein [Bacteroidota bacterium]